MFHDFPIYPIKGVPQNLNVNDKTYRLVGKENDIVWADLDPVDERYFFQEIFISY